jgi:hypothetical protein
LIDPFVGDACRGKRDPEEQRRRVPENTHKADHERRVRMKPLLDDLHGMRGRGHLPGQQIPQADGRNDNETHKLHHRAHPCRREQLRKPGKRDAGVDHLHKDGPHPDQKRMLEAPPGPRIDDGDIDRADRDAGEVTGKKTGAEREPQALQ